MPTFDGHPIPQNINGKVQVLAPFKSQICALLQLHIYWAGECLCAKVLVLGWSAYKIMTSICLWHCICCLHFVVTFITFMRNSYATQMRPQKRAKQSMWSQAISKPCGLSWFASELYLQMSCCWHKHLNKVFSNSYSVRLKACDTVIR